MLIQKLFFVNGSFLIDLCSNIEYIYIYIYNPQMCVLYTPAFLLIAQRRLQQHNIAHEI